MNRDPQNTFDSTPANPRLLWMAIVLLGAVYFFVGHNVQVSRFEDFAPWSEAGVAVESGGNVLKGLALSLIGVFGMYLLLRRDGRPLHWGGWLPAAMAFYVAWAAASVLWSGDPGLSCRKLAVLGFCVLGALGFARQFRPRDLALIALAVTAAYLIVGIAAEVALGTFRPWASDYRFAGTVHPNTQGAQMTLLCLAAFCLARFSPRDETRLRPLYWTLFALGLVFLYLTKSRTSCAAFAVALAALWMISVSVRTRLLALATAGFLVCSAALLGSLFSLDIEDAVAEFVLLGREEESGKLTGRIPIWKDLLGYIGEKPLQGYGYEAFWTEKRIEDVSDDAQWTLREAHNGYLDATLSVGLIGVAVLLAIGLQGIVLAAGAFRSTDDVGAALTFCLLIFIVFNACLESGLIAPNLITLLVGCGIMQLLSVRSAIASHSHAPRGNEQATLRFCPVRETGPKR